MKKSVVALVLMLGSSLTQASIYDFTWNNGLQDLLTGYVDTDQDALFITSVQPWNPGSNGIFNPLLPDFSSSDFPGGEWKLGAVQQDGSSYDIADDWNGILGGTWGFASDITITDMDYVNGSYAESPYFKYYMSIGIDKIYFPFAGFYSYSLTGESVMNPDGSFSSQLSNFLAYQALNASPQSLDDFSTEVSQFSMGGLHKISKRTDVSESGSLMIFMLGFLSLVYSRFGVRKKS